MEKIQIKYHNKNIDRIEAIKGGDWYDLRAAETVQLKAGEFKLISLGVSMKLPEGYEAHIVPRSSTYKKWKIIQTNHMGVIDNSYSGDNDEWKYPAFCLESRDILEIEEDGFTKVVSGTWICKGDKIAQFRIMETQPKFEFEEVEEKIKKTLLDRKSNLKYILNDV